MSHRVEDYLPVGDQCMPWLRYGRRLWAFGTKISVETNLGKCSLSGHAEFFHQLRQQKITGLGILKQ